MAIFGFKGISYFANLRRDQAGECGEDSRYVFNICNVHTPRLLLPPLRTKPSGGSR